MDNNNLVLIGADFRKEIQARAGLSRATVYRALEELKEKQYITPLPKELKAKFDVFNDHTYICLRDRKEKL